MALRAPRSADPLVASGIAEIDHPVLAAVDTVLDRVGHRDDLTHLPAPLPPSEAFPEGRLSPRLLTLLAKTLDVSSGDRVLLVGDPLTTFAAVLRAHSGPDTQIVIITDNTARARWTARRLGIEDTPDAPTIIGKDEDAPRGPFTHILTFRHGERRDDLVGLLAPDGVLLDAHIDGPRSTLVKHVRIHGEGGDIDLSKYWIGPRVRSKRHRPGRTPEGAMIGRLLHLERMQENAWMGLAVTPTEQGVLRAVRETFLGADETTDLVSLPDDPERRLARRIFHLAYLEQVAGTRAVAGALYRASLAVHETAEAWTFYGWVRSQEGSLQEAVDSCRRAIDLDPTFGNPYNDIGAYMMAEGHTEDAKIWFRRATTAPRYAAPHYPYTNLGRVYLREGDLDAARSAVEHALEMMPGYPPAERLLREIESREAHDPSMR